MLAVSAPRSGRRGKEGANEGGGLLVARRCDEAQPGRMGRCLSSRRTGSSVAEEGCVVRMTSRASSTTSVKGRDNGFFGAHTLKAFMRPYAAARNLLETIKTTESPLFRSFNSSAEGGLNGFLQEVRIHSSSGIRLTHD
jgi:hypothetical protein